MFSPNLLINDFTHSLLSGFISDFCLSRWHTPRCTVLAAWILLMCAGVALITPAVTGLLYPACLLVGLSYGSFNVLVPAILSDFFGTKNLGAIYASSSIALGVGCLAFATYLTGKCFAILPCELISTRLQHISMRNFAHRTLKFALGKIASTKRCCTAESQLSLWLLSWQLLA